MKVSTVFGLLLMTLASPAATADEMESAAGDNPVTGTSEAVLHHTVFYQSLPETPNYRNV